MLPGLNGLKSRKLEGVMVFALAGLVALGGVVSKSAVVGFGIAFHLLFTSALFSVSQS